MKNLKLKMFATILLIVSMLCIMQPSIFATNENIAVLKKSDKEYLLYLEENQNNEFEFALSNDKNVDKNSLSYKICAQDTSNEDKNNIAYIDETLFDKYLNSPTYIWVRNLDGDYLVEGVELNLKECVQDEDIDLTNEITKKIAVNTKNTVTTQEEINDIKVTKTVGKVDVSEDGENYYCLVKLPNTDDYNKFMKIAEQISNNKVENNMYKQLKVAGEFAKLYEKLVPDENSNEWVKVENRQILQPENSKNGDQYILWINNVNSKGGVKFDVQFLTCFEDYKNEVISEKVTTVLPKTYDSPILLVIFGILVIAFFVVLISRSKINIKSPNKGKK